MKKILLWVSVFIMMIGITNLAYAGGRLPYYPFADPELEGYVGGWQQDEKGWRYYVNAEKTEWIASDEGRVASPWIDSDNDGIYQQFLFERDGYINIDVDYGGFGYDSTGARFDNYIVGTRTEDEIRAMKDEKDEWTTAQNNYVANAKKWLSENNSYNADGISLVAIDMLNSTRAVNNEKYGIFREQEHFDYWTVTYNNGFRATYYKREGTHGSRANPNYAYDLSTDFPSAVLKGINDSLRDASEMNRQLMDLGFTTYDTGRTGVVNVQALSELYAATWYDHWAKDGIGRLDIGYRAGVTPPYITR